MFDSQVPTLLSPSVQQKELPKEEIARMVKDSEGDVKYLIRVRNKPVAHASTGLITFGRGPAARVAVVSVSELNPCPGRAAIEQLAPVYACVMDVCLQLAAPDGSQQTPCSSTTQRTRQAVDTHP
jgi:hypothetical protein